MSSTWGDRVRETASERSNTCIKSLIANWPIMWTLLKAEYTPLPVVYILPHKIPYNSALDGAIIGWTCMQSDVVDIIPMVLINNFDLFTSILKYKVLKLTAISHHWWHFSIATGLSIELHCWWEWCKLPGVQTCSFDQKWPPDLEFLDYLTHHID